MSGCQIQRGLFTLRDCGNSANDTCHSCGKGLCQEHTVFSDLKPYCALCQSKLGDKTSKQGESQKQFKEPQLATDADWNRPGYSQRWRDQYYHSSGFVPYYYAWDQTYYSSSDRHGFSARAEGDLESDDMTSNGFSDS